jgi:hypothetical protein
VWFVREPAAGFSRRKQIGERRVERGGFFRRNIVAGTRDNEQPGCRCHAFEIDAAVNAGFIFIADDDEQRNGEFLQRRLHLPQCRPLELKIEHRVGVAFRGMFREHAGKFGIAAGILVLLRLTHRRIGIFRRGRLDPLRRKHFPDFRGECLHFLALFHVRR